MKYRIEYSSYSTRTVVTDCALIELSCGCHNLEQNRYEFEAVSDESAMQAMERFSVGFEKRSFAPDTRKYWVTKLVRIDQEEKTSLLADLDRGELKILIPSTS